MALITVRSAPTLEQMVQLQYAFLKARYRIAYVVGWVVVAATLSLAFWSVSITRDPTYLAMALSATLYLAALPPWYRWIIRRRMQRPGNQSFFIPTTYEIDETDLKAMSAGGSSSVTPWTAIVEVRPWNGGLLLMLSEITFHVFYPERFATPPEWARFEELARRRPAGKPL